MEIRPERKGEEETIHSLTLTAFESAPFSDGSEASIVDQLRDDRDLTLSLVAAEADKIVGHVAFSPVAINGAHDGWYGLGPVSVRPDLQKQGIGSQLIKQGLSQIKEQGATGCVLVGNPDYYTRFGFRSDGDLTYGDVPTQYVQWLSFTGKPARGVLEYAPAFAGA